MRRFSLLVKAVSLAAVLLVLMMGLSMIGGLANERVAYRAQAAASIEGSLAGAQTLAGMVLTRRCVETFEATVIKDKEKTVERSEVRTVLRSLPQSSSWTTESKIEPRYRGLYKVNSYALNAEEVVDWKTARDLAVLPLKAPAVAVRCDAPLIEFTVTDPRGIRAVRQRGPNGDLEVKPSTNGGTFNRGFEAKLPVAESALDAPLRLRLVVELVGIESVGFVPLAVDNTVTLKSDWPHPSFGGEFLPLTRTVSAQGFDARWSVSSLAAQARSQLGSSAAGCAQTRSSTKGCLQSFGVDFIDPVNPASLSDRATKYGILFIVLTFAGIVLLEVLKGQAVHPVQYLLIGAAMAVFFLLLLSLSEHIAFIKAYVTAAVACVALLTVYAKAVLGGWQRALPMSAGLAVLYCVLYMVLQSEQHALLAGSLLVFAVLAGVMLLTRHVKWGGLNEGA